MTARVLPPWLIGATLWLAIAATAGTASAQQEPQSTPAQAPAAGQAPSERLTARAPAERYAELRFSNRPIVTFRAVIVPENPAGRVEGALRVLSDLADRRVTGPIASRQLRGASVITVAGRDVFGIVPDDVTVDAGEDLAQLTRDTIARLEVALAEAVEARTPGRLARASARSLLATALLAVVFFALMRLLRLLTDRLVAQTRAHLERSQVASNIGVLSGTRVLDAARGLVKLTIAAGGLIAVYVWATYTLRQFPLTRPWGEALGEYLVGTLASLGWSALQTLPGLFTAGVIFAAARFAVRITSLFFDAVAQGRLQLGRLNALTVVPTRRLATTLIWMFAAVVAYPYLPGSQTEAFKGISLFVGLVVSLGSSGIVNQVMSGFMLTYSDSLAPGDYVRVCDVEGTITHLGVLSTKVKTRYHEYVTIPNAVLIAGTATNYSRCAAEGVYAAVPLTIGYDTPWRQVEALLLLAAERTTGIRGEPPPKVQQTSLSDFYVEYTLLVCPEQPELRGPVLAALRANIQDAFNEAGVQIMSPHYESDPAGAKLVARDRWFAAPARPAEMVETSRR